MALVENSDKAFYISKYEVSNREYREFTDFVRDSIILNLLGMVRLAKEKDRVTGCIKYSSRIAWDKKMDWELLIKRDGNFREKIDVILLTPDERINGRIAIDVRKIIYEFSYFNRENRFDKMKDADWIWPKGQNAHWGQYKVFPDTLVGIDEGIFPLSSSDESYFQNKLYNDFPVVGITAIQAMAFCDWKAHTLNNELARNGIFNYQFEVTLPTTAQWQAAEIYQSRKENRKTLMEGNKITQTHFDPSYKKGIKNLNNNVSEWLGDSTYMDSTFTLRQSHPKAAGKNFLSKNVAEGNFQPNKGYEYVGFRFALTIKEIHPTNNCDER